MKHYSKMSLQEYLKAKSSGMLWEIFPEATGSVNEDLQAVCVHNEETYALSPVPYDSASGLILGDTRLSVKTRYFYDIIDEEAEYDF